MCRKYEGIFIIKNMEDSKKIEEIINIINNMIVSECCDIFHKEKLGVKDLVYEVKGHKKGYFYYIKFKVPDSLKDIGKISIKINTLEEIIKHMIFELKEI